MRIASIALVALAGLATASTSARRSFKAKTDDGFPSPNKEQLMAIQKKADGTLSNAPPPAKLADSSLTTFQLIAFNENFEVAFFQSLLQNITTQVAGYELPTPGKKEELAGILETVIAQEQLHAISAKNVLDKFGAFAPPPCDYKFPTSNVYDAIALAETFTAVVLGTLQDAAQLFAQNGDDGAVRSVASTIGQEGQQSGFYRAQLALMPSEKPFLTTSVAPYAFSALQGFIASCPFDIAAKIPIPIFPPLTVESGKKGTDVQARDQHLTFSVDLAEYSGEQYDKWVGNGGDGLFITYLSGQLLPISVPIANAHWAGRKVTFEANFPFEENVMFGLSIAALTTKSGFAKPDDIVDATLAAPGLIQVNDKLV